MFGEDPTVHQFSTR